MTTLHSCPHCNAPAKDGTPYQPYCCVGCKTAYALVSAALHLGTFGADPMADKGMEGIDAFQTGRVAHAVEEGDWSLIDRAPCSAGQRSARSLPRCTCGRVGVRRPRRGIR